MHSMNGIQTIQKYAILFQSADFPNDTKKSLKSRENLANPGKTWQRKVRKNYAKSIIHLPRQDVAGEAVNQYLQWSQPSGEMNFPHFSHNNEPLA